MRNKMTTTHKGPLHVAVSHACGRGRGLALPKQGNIAAAAANPVSNIVHIAPRPSFA